MIMMSVERLEGTSSFGAVSDHGIEEGFDKYPAVDIEDIEKVIGENDEA